MDVLIVIDSTGSMDNCESLSLGVTHSLVKGLYRFRLAFSPERRTLPLEGYLLILILYYRFLTNYP